MRLTLKAALIGLVGVLVLLPAGQGALSLWNIEHLKQNAEDIGTNWLPSVQVLGQIKYAVTGYRLQTIRYAAVSDEGVRKNLKARISDVQTTISTLFATYEPLISSAEEGDIWNGFKAKWENYTEAVRRSEKQAASSSDALALDDKLLRPMFDEALAVLDVDTDLNHKGATDSMEAARNQFESARTSTFLLGLTIFLFGAASILYVIFRVTNGLTSLTKTLSQMAEGENVSIVPGSGRRDEIGDMARNVVKIRENAETKAREESAAKTEHDRITAAQRRTEMVKFADAFESAVGEIMETVSSASTKLEASAGSLSSTAERSQHLTTAVTEASEQASGNVQSVASATEELASSVSEISRQVQDSTKMSFQAVDQARKTNDRVGELARAASRIGDVVELINTIAGQTNLLALNATIEAARAGEMGRGFAIVASEVKALAEQTAKATGEISQQIAGIQSATKESVGDIEEIGATITRLSEISAAIASAVEEQSAATQEISRNIQQAAQGTMAVQSNIADVQRGTAETGNASAEVLSAAQALSRDSNKLRSEVARFLNTVRAA